MLPYNPIADCDSYKLTHWKYYPEGTQFVYSYLESRGGKYPKNVFFGLQGLIKQYLTTPFDQVDIEEMRDISAAHFGTDKMFNDSGFQYILNNHGGYWPVEIKAVPEGTVVPYKNVLMTIENTDPECPFTTSFLETMALRLWYPITVASRVYEVKRKLKPFFERTSDTLDGLDFAFHNFGDRGATSYDSAMIAGAAHLTSFKGTDSIPAIRYLRHYYGSEMPGLSVAATEHSIMCAYQESNEFESFKRIIEVSEPGTIISVVSDSWDIFRACRMWGSLADKIKEKNLTLVVRPDSGEMREVLPQVLEILVEGFGYKGNAKEFRVLDSVKVLWGDGMNEDTATGPFEVAEKLGISADSIVVGAGGGTVQVDVNRDTNKFAFKASNVTIDGEDIPVAKNPITDRGKMSKKGKLDLLTQMGKFLTINQDMRNVFLGDSMLKTVYRNGELLEETTFDEIRRRTNSFLR